MRNNNYICHAPYLRNHISYDCHLWCSVKWLYLQVFLSMFVKIFTFQVVKRLKGKKMAQNVENFCMSHLTFQEPYIIWSSFMVHMYVLKDNISRHFFSFLSKFQYSRSLGGGKRAKNGPKWQEILFVSLWISGIVHHMIIVFGAHV